MKAVLCTRLGGPDDLELRDVPDPVAGPGEVVVKVAAAALNFFDTLIIAGKYQTKPELPFSPAAEFAGVVESLGPGVSAVAPGDRVAGYIGYGAARERIAVPAENLIKLPAGLDLDRAAGIIVTYGTSYYALKDRAGLKAGETLAVLGASGGVGLAAVELGKIMGARVIACASSDDKLAFARQHGADAVVNYASENLREGLRTTGRRARHRRGVRSGRRSARRGRVALARLGRTVPRRRLCGRRDPEAAAQSGAAQELRRARRVLGQLDRP